MDNDEELPIEPILKDGDVSRHSSSPVQPVQGAPQHADVVTPYTFNSVSKYTVKELVFKPDCFEVLDDSKNGVYTIKGKAIDRSGTKTLFAKDSDDRLFKMTENLNTFLQVMYMFDFRTKSVYTMRKKGVFPGFGRGTVFVWKGKGTDGSPFIRMTTSGGRSMITIVDIETGKQIATMKRSMLGPRRFLTGADFYRVSISPGFDVPFVLMLCVCADEQYTDFNR
ncbi:unnamed protein product [Agarophyton chilense]